MKVNLLLNLFPGNIEENPESLDLRADAILLLPLIRLDRPNGLVTRSSSFDLSSGLPDIGSNKVYYCFQPLSNMFKIIVLSFGPSNSIKTTFCHVPKTSFPCSTGIDSDVPINDESIWSGMCCGSWGCL